MDAGTQQGCQPAKWVRLWWYYFGRGGRRERGLRPSTQPDSPVFNMMVQVTSCNFLIAGQPSVLFYALKDARSVLASV